MDSTDRPKRRTRRHSARQLQHRPITVGGVTVTTELKGPKVIVKIVHPAGAEVDQCELTDTSDCQKCERQKP